MLSDNLEYAEGLAGATLASRSYGGVLFTPSESLGHSARGTIDRNTGRVSEYRLMGGYASISADIETELASGPAPPVSGSITGVVTDTSGTVLADVHVTAYGHDPDSTDFPMYRAHEDTTGPDGAYTIGHLEPGLYWLAFEDTTGVRSSESYPDAPDTPGHGDLVSVSPTPAPPTEVDEVLVDPVSWEAQRVARLAGTDRYSTAIAISRSSHRQADTVVIVSGERFADALSAAAVAGAYHAPLLLTRRDSLPAGLIDEVRRLGATRIVVVGGAAAVSDGVADALDDAGLPVAVRIAGSDRYETSALAYRHLRLTAGLPTIAPEPFVARGDDFPDALSASPFAYRQVRPILLVRPTEAPGVIRTVFSDFEIRRAYVLGGTRAVGDEVLAELAVASGAATIDATRLAGADRYETSALVAGLSNRPYDFLGVTSGRAFPDALVGGVLAGARGGTVLLTPPDALHPAAASVLSEEAATLQQVRVFGGTAAVDAATFAEVIGAATP